VRILHITAPSPAGGLERVVHGLARGFLDHGHDVTVLASIGSLPDHPFVDWLTGDDIPVRAVSLGSRAYLAEIRAIEQAAEAVAAEIIHTHGFRSDVLGLVAARRRDTPVVSTVHGLTGGSRAVRLYERIQRSALRRFDGVVAVSRPLADQFAGLGFAADQLHMVRNALLVNANTLDRADARRALGLPADGAVVGWVGRFGAEKGPDLFVDMVAGLAPDVTGVMIGVGPELVPARDRARVRGVAVRLVLTGRLPAADRYLKALDVLVLSSRTEGTPMILLEAMAAGTPVVASDIPGYAKVATAADGVPAAELVAPGDPVALGAALNRVLAEPEVAASLRDRGVARAEQFDLERLCDLYLEIYERVLVNAPA
jgi:glycosyltransferase involved in cell wall biosynthesis